VTVPPHAGAPPLVKVIAPVAFAGPNTGISLGVPPADPSVGATAVKLEKNGLTLTVVEKVATVEPCVTVIVYTVLLVMALQVTWLPLVKLLPHGVPVPSEMATVAVEGPNTGVSFGAVPEFTSALCGVRLVAVAGVTVTVAVAVAMVPPWVTVIV